MMKGFLIVGMCFFIVACSNQVESQVNKNMLDEYVTFTYTIPELEGYVITKIDVAPYEGEANRIDIYYTNQEDVDRNWDLLDLEEALDEEFDLKTVYGPYEEWPDYGLVLSQMTEDVTIEYKESFEVDESKIKYNTIVSGEDTFLSFYIRIDEALYQGTLFHPEGESKEDVEKEIEEVYKQLVDEMTQ
ncbi:hypothetical protein [Alteribacter aurantiacus]|uniref:hypothetical protein n=1 Tax=Alteribacter aurantiacus TaxID=254410 RepID=UPI00041BD750|nr:hypothetical protein [Alteribacter aurantiacus]